MGEEIEEEIRIKLSESRKELDYGPRSVVLDSGAEVFLEDHNKGEVVGYNIPEGRKIKIFFLGKINEEDEKTRCTAIEFYRKTEENKYINDLHELKLEGKDIRFIRRGVSILYDSKDLIKQLELKEQGEKVESEEEESKSVGPEKKETKNVDLQQKRYEEIGKSLERSGKYIHDNND